MLGGKTPAVPADGVAARPLAPTRAGRVLYGLYFLSGVTALCYEVLWVRMLSLQFGVSIFGAVITAAAFMAGLAGGALIGARLSAVVRAPLSVFALLEAGVAVYALVLPAINAAVGQLLGHAAAAAGLYGWYAMQCSAALLLLAAPAAAMGTGFALMLRAGEAVGAGVGELYGVNTLGGVAGALLPLWSLPALGWSRAVDVAAALGLVAAAAAVAVSRYGAPLSPRAPMRTAPLPATGTSWAYAGVGAAALVLEIAWTRLFGMVLLRTEYVMAVILAVFLAGIGAGSLLARRGVPGRWFAALPALAGGFAVASLWALPYISRWAERSDFSSLASAMAWQGGAVALATLPVTLVLGAWLPLLARRLGDPVQHGTRLYAVNAAGAAAGALLSGFVLIPWLGTAGTVCAGALVLFACGMVWVPARRWWAAAVPLLLLALPVRALPPVSVLLPQTHGGSRDLYVHEDAISVTHVVQERDGQRVLLSDLQRMDASTDPSAVALQRDQARLPLLLHPAPRRVLFLGLGTGISASGSLPFPGVQRRTAVELSRGAIAAAPRWFARANDDAPRRMRVEWADARHYLQVDRQAYDVIIGDVFHPDLVGRSSLLSVQQFRRARARLAPGGLFVQWLALNQFDPDSLAVVMRSFQHVFPGAVGFIDGFRLALVGPENASFAPLAAVLSHLPAAGDVPTLSGGEGAWTWLGRYWGPLEMAPGPVQDEWAPYIEFSLPQARFRDQVDTASVLKMLLRRRPNVGRAERALAVPAADREAFERGYIATDLGTRSWLATLEGDDAQAQRLLRLAYEGNPKDRWIAFSLADRMFNSLPEAAAHGLDRRQALQAILRVRPDHAGALRALWHLEAAAGHTAQAKAYRERLRAVSPYSKLD